MLNASSRQLFRSRARHACASRVAIAEESRRVENPYFLDVFDESKKNLAAALRTRAEERAACAARARRNATCGVAARANMLDQPKTLVFFPRCSNPDAVFAIPAGTLTTTPLTQARRAAWRRSERRRRSQRRKRARRRRSAGRRSKHALLPSLRLRTTSMTASHGPARVEGR
jgi:hypothetical protein